MSKRKLKKTRKIGECDNSEIANENSCKSRMVDTNSDFFSKLDSVVLLNIQNINQFSEQMKFFEIFTYLPGSSVIGPPKRKLPKIQMMELINCSNEFSQKNTRNNLFHVKASSVVVFLFGSAVIDTDLIKNQNNSTHQNMISPSAL